MAVFGGLALTNKGRSLFTKAQAGKELKIKRVVIGDGELGSTESLLGLEQLKHEIVSFNIANIKTVNDKIAKILFVLKNEDIATGFYWRELGVIAEDPDTKQEILYCYGNARDNGDYIGAGGGTDILEKYINIDLVIENVQNVTAVIDDSVVFIARNEFENAIRQINDNINNLKGHRYHIEVTEPLKDDEIQLPFYYKVGAECLDVYMCGNLLIRGNSVKNGNYIEIRK